MHHQRQIVVLTFINRFVHLKRSVALKSLRRLLVCLLALYSAAWLRSLVGFARPLQPLNSHGSNVRYISFAGGSSIGSWVAAGLLYLQGLPSFEAREAEWKDILEKILSFSRELRPGWMFKRLDFINEAHKRFLQPVLARSGAFESCQGRLHVPLTKFSRSPPFLRLQVVNTFHDKVHLEHALVAGASIPGVQDWPPRNVPSQEGELEHGFALDAGFLDNCPRFGSHGTLRVNWVIASMAEIKAQRLFNPVQFVRPPSKQELDALVDEGYRNAQAWCAKMDGHGCTIFGNPVQHIATPDFPGNVTPASSFATPTEEVAEDPETQVEIKKITAQLNEKESDLEHVKWLLERSKRAEEQKDELIKQLQSQLDAYDRERAR